MATVVRRCRRYSAGETPNSRSKLRLRYVTDPAVYAALPEQQAVTRGTHITATTFEYHATDFNDYGQPWHIHQTGDFIRRVDRTFQHAFVPYSAVPDVERDGAGGH